MVPGNETQLIILCSAVMNLLGNSCGGHDSLTTLQIGTWLQFCHPLCGLYD